MKWLAWSPALVRRVVVPLWFNTFVNKTTTTRRHDEEETSSNALGALWRTDLFN